MGKSSQTKKYKPPKIKITMWLYKDEMIRYLAEQGIEKFTIELVEQRTKGQLDSHGRVHDSRLPYIMGADLAQRYREFLRTKTNPQ